MDYKYIEQLLERYWAGETSLQEEAILRNFFSQDEIPAGLIRYKALFAYQQKAIGQHIADEGFDARLLARTVETPVKAQRITLSQRLMPLYKAAAVVAISLILGEAVQTSFGPDKPATDYNYNAYKDTYSDTETAYSQMADALRMVSEGLNGTTAQTDSTHTQPDTGTGRP